MTTKVVVDIEGAYDLGRRAYRKGKKHTDNPYNLENQIALFDSWERGYQYEKYEQGEEE